MADSYQTNGEVLQDFLSGDQMSICAECCTAELEKSTTWNNTKGLPLYFLFLQCCTFPGVSH